MGFKAVVLSWDAIFDQEKNKFHTYAIDYLKRCSRHQTKIVIFSTQKETDPTILVKLNENGISIDRLIWAKSLDAAQIKKEVTEQVVYDETRNLSQLPEEELFYAESHLEFHKGIFRVDTFKKIKGELTRLTPSQIEELSRKIPEMLDDYFVMTEEMFLSWSSLMHAAFMSIPLPLENSRLFRRALLQLQRDFEDNLFDCMENDLPKVHAICQHETRVFF